MGNPRRSPAIGPHGISGRSRKAAANRSLLTPNPAGASLDRTQEVGGSSPLAPLKVPGVQWSRHRARGRGAGGQARFSTLGRRPRGSGRPRQTLCHYPAAETVLPPGSASTLILSACIGWASVCAAHRRGSARRRPVVFIQRVAPSPARARRLRLVVSSSDWRRAPRRVPSRRVSRGVWPGLARRRPLLATTPQ
jgi:hypothetical protein